MEFASLIESELLNDQIPREGECHINPLECGGERSLVEALRTQGM